MTAQFPPPSDALLDQLKSLLGKGGWKPTDDAARYFEDPRLTFTGHARLIALPKSTQQVAEIVKLCNTHKAGLIPYGGGTGVVAGQLSPQSDNAIILSMERMNRIREVSTDEGMIVAEAGCVLEALHDAAKESNMMFPLSMGSKGSCSIGGNLATNAGGIQVLRYGNARDLCLGIEAVLPNGEILSELAPVRKNNTGYDMRHLLIGSEGTLGIITAASLVLKPIDPEAVTVLCALASPSQGLELYNVLKSELGEAVSGLELMSALGMELVTGHFEALSNPLAEPSPWYVLAEITGPSGMRDRVLDMLGRCMEQDLLQDAVIAESEAQRAMLWELRENTPEANRANHAFCNSDTAVPISKVDAFIAATEDAIRAINPDLRINSYGHIGDGNIHHNVLPAPGVTKKEFAAAHADTVEAVRMAINETTAQFGGSVSAEHGIGRLKTKDMELYVSAAKRDAMKAIKAALDPNNIMNPGALIG
ncbi:MAG: FAD-binding oxidoreductase [Pseudomonadota bacterium]